MATYVENKSDIIHETTVDFVSRPCSQDIHIMQYDDSLPMCKVYLNINYTEYVTPLELDARIIIIKSVINKIKKPILGFNEDRTAVYFQIDSDISNEYGSCIMYLELYEGDTAIACSSPIKLVIDKNPKQEKWFIQEGDLNEYLSRNW